MPRNVRDTRRVPLGVYRGLRFGLILHPHFPPDVYLEGAATRQSMLSRDHQGPRAVLNAVERLANAYGSECERVRQDLGIAEAQLRDHQARLGKPFPHDAYLSELTTLRDALKTSLSGIAADEGGGPQLGAHELADRIKALEARQTVTASPERVGQRQFSAEEPVTARIRRQREKLAAPLIDSGENALHRGDPALISQPKLG